MHIAYNITGNDITFRVFYRAVSLPPTPNTIPGTEYTLVDQTSWQRF